MVKEGRVEGPGPLTSTGASDLQKGGSMRGRRRVFLYSSMIIVAREIDVLTIVTATATATTTNTY